MSTNKIAITLDENLLVKLDRLVKNHVFKNRSKVIQDAVREKLARIEKNQLSRECAKLDRSFEKSMADEGLSSEVNSWPEY